MFYTLVGKAVITKITTPRDYLYIFIIGSIGYVVLHWYLHMDKREGFIEKIRELLYYAMVIDAITAYMLTPVATPTNENAEISDHNDRETPNHNHNNSSRNVPETDQQYVLTPEQRKLISMKTQEVKKMQQLRHKE